MDNSVYKPNFDQTESRHYLFSSLLSVSLTIALKGTAAAVSVIISFPVTSRSYPNLVLLPEVLNI